MIAETGVPDTGHIGAMAGVICQTPIVIAVVDLECAALVGLWGNALLIHAASIARNGTMKRQPPENIIDMIGRRGGRREARFDRARGVASTN